MNPKTSIFVAAGAMLLLNIARAQNNTSWSTTGNIGIGTTAPNAKLEVVGGTATGLDDVLWLSGGAAAYNSGPNLVFHDIFGGSNPYPAWRLAQIGAVYSSEQNSKGGALLFETNTGTSDADISEKMRIQPSGKVGIGTANPLTPLQVAGTITAGSSDSTQGVDYLYGSYTSGKLFTLGSLYSSAASFLGYGVKAKPGAVGYLSSTAINVGRSAYEANNGFLAFWTGAAQVSTDGGVVSFAERMRIDASGNVGIGTTNPTQKLSVNGTIQAKEVIVQTGWSDYVFAPEYRLAPLSEVASQIKEQGHLPGIPSAKEVASQGVSLGQMEKLLLAKIEELTLHQIELEKRLDEQGIAVSELRKENAALKARY